MSFEPDTNDIRIRQLKEEIAKIREEQFSRAFPTNNVGSPSVVNSDSGIPAPTIGVSSIIPAVIRITKDTGVIDLLKFDGKNVNKDFTLGETVTGQSSGATATVGDIDTLTSTTGTLTLVPSSITGTFSDGENLNGSGAGGTNIADADGTLFTQTGRGHLNAGAGSIIADGDNISPPLEIHFIDNADQDGQVIYLRAQDGQTIRLRRPTTNDANTGNLDIDESFNLIENALVFFQYQVASNATPTGGWVPLITEVSAGVGGTGGAFSFPILYPKENLGTQNGVINLSLSQNDGHYKQVTLDGDASITFSNLPPAINGFKFYLLTIQDGTGGHVYTDLPNTVLFESALLSQLQTAPNAQTLWQFSTADGGANWHANVIQSQGSVAGQTPWLSDINANTFNLFNLDVLRYADGLQPGADGIIGFGVYGSAVENDTKLKWSIPRGETGKPRFYEWQFDLQPAMTLQKQPNTESWTLDLLFQGAIQNTKGISFFHTAGALSSITPGLLDLRYESGFGAGQGGLHAFHVAGSTFAQFEIREDVIRANRNIDMITNNIFAIDQIQFSNIQGFFPPTDHGIRAIGGGNTGIEMNIPQGTFDTTFDIFFENVAETTSDKEYSFALGGFTMFTKSIKDTLGLLFTNGGNFLDLATHLQMTGGVNPGPNTPQTIKFVVKDQFFVEQDMFELTGTEIFGGGGMKMFTDLNLQTQNINNVDVLKFAVDGGEIFGTEYAMGADASDTAFNFNVPLDRDYTFSNNANPIANLDPTGFQLLANPSSLNPQMGAREFSLSGLHTLGITGMLDGSFRLVDNAGSSDIMVATGGSIINLTTGVGGISFIGFTADADLNMGTFNIVNLDVLRYAVDGGVIGFGEYGSAVESDNSKLKWSIPTGKRYEWQINLDRVADMNTASFHMRSNVQTTSPSIISDGAFILGASHVSGSLGMFDGESRLVGTDVIFRSGGINVNLTTLSAGGADNLGNHQATQDLDLNGFFLRDYVGFTSTFGHSMFLNVGSITWDLDLATQAFIWSGDGIELMTLTNTGLDMQFGRVSNLANPAGPLDAVNLQTLDSGFVTTNTNQTTGLTGNKTWDGNHNFNGSAMVIGADSGDIVQILSRVSGDLIPNAPATGLGDVTRTWNMFASQFRFGGGTIVDAISNISTAFGSSELMTAQAIQQAITAGGGGGSTSFIGFTADADLNMGTFNIFNVDVLRYAVDGGVIGFGEYGSAVQAGGSKLKWSVPTSRFYEWQVNQNRVATMNTASFHMRSNAQTTSPSVISDGAFILGASHVSGSVGMFNGESRLVGTDVIFRSGSTNVNLTTLSAGGVTDKIQEGNTSVEIVDFGTGQIIFTVDGSNVGTWFGTSGLIINNKVSFRGDVDIGNSSADTVDFNADIGSNLLPNSTSGAFDLGNSSKQWGELFVTGTGNIDRLILGGGTDVNFISTNDLSNSNNSLMTSQAIQTAISNAGGGNFVTIDTTQVVSGRKTWTNSGNRFASSLEIDGDLNHDGSRIGFRGRFPQTISPITTISLGSSNATIASKLNQLILTLRGMGIVG